MWAQNKSLIPGASILGDYILVSQSKYTMRQQLQTMLHKMDRTHVSSREVIKLLNPTQFVSMQYGL